MIGIVDLMDTPRNRERKANALRLIEMAAEKGELYEALETYRANKNFVSYEEYQAAYDAGVTAYYEGE
jgi:hypothetical protein